MKYKTALIVFFLIVILLTRNQPAGGMARTATSQLTDGETDPPPGNWLVLRVYFPDLSILNRLAAYLDIWEVDHKDGYLVAMVTRSTFDALLNAGFRVEIDQDRTARLAKGNQPLPGQTSGIPGFPCYRTVEETYADLARLAADHPTLASWIDIGDSWEKTMPGNPPGYDISTLVLTNTSIAGMKPKFYLMAAIHAREYVTAELATRFAEYLVSNYGTDPDITWLLDRYEVHITPHANPDGRKIAEGGELWRKNTDDDDGCSILRLWGTDMNRNSSFHWGGVGASSFPCSEVYRGPSAASEPETQAIENYLRAIFPDQRGPGDQDPAPQDTNGIFITLHSYSQLVLFPWGWTTTAPPNNTALETLGRKFGYFNHYKVCQSGENGCIYQTSGTTDDFAYGELGVAAYTFELGNEFFEACSAFENTIWPDNLPALIYALKAARLPYLDPAGPETLEVQVQSPAVSRSAVTLSALADDTRYDDGGWTGDEPVQAISAARYTIDVPSWDTGTAYPMQAIDGNFDENVEAITAEVDTTGLAPGVHLLFVESQDAAGNWGVPTAVFLEIAGGNYQPGLEPTESSASALRGQTVSYELTASNLGSQTDTFQVQVSGNLWPVELPADPIGPLAPSESLLFSVSVAIPADASGGSVDQAEIRLISQGDPDRSAAALLRTIALAPGAYLPLVGR